MESPFKEIKPGVFIVTVGNTKTICYGNDAMHAEYRRVRVIQKEAEELTVKMNGAPIWKRKPGTKIYGV